LSPIKKAFSYFMKEGLPLLFDLINLTFYLKTETESSLRKVVSNKN
jgi:hypothetical protein